MRFNHILLLLLICISTNTWAQGVAIGSAGASPDPSAMLDIQSVQKGVLVPRMTAAQRNAIISPAPGLLVYQTDGEPGLYLNNGTTTKAVWIILAANWGLKGNDDVTQGAHFLGTTDAAPVDLRTNNSLRVRIDASGAVLINGTLPKFSSDALEALGAGVTGASNPTFEYPITGYSAGPYAGIYGENNSGGQGVWGENSSIGVGVYGTNLSTGSGVKGASTLGKGVEALNNSSINPAVYASNQNPLGIGIVGTTSIDGYVHPGASTGVLGVGETYGIVGIAQTWGNPNLNEFWGGYFASKMGTNSYAFVGGNIGPLDFAILSAGVKSTMVKDEQNRNRIMFCPEAPEVLFQDVGTGRLVNGRARITIDPLLSRNIYVSESKPLKVFIQPEGECNGVYVTNKSVEGFDVIELQGGTSNTPFTWQIIANRANTTDEAGRVASRFADARFPAGPGPVKIKNVKSDEAQTTSPLSRSGKMDN